MISPQTIEKIKETARIEDVVGEFVSLKKSGSTFKGLCPFHQEKTPSFTVNPSRNIYKCFGCGKGGDSIGFLREHEHLSYPESLRWLANRYQIDIEETESTDEQKQERDHRESLMIVNRYAADFFIKTMNDTPEGKAIAQAYFRERGLLESTIEKFELGWCPDSPYNPKDTDLPVSFTSHALADGYKLEFLEELGLTRTKDNRSYDFYRERVMFPIHNLSGRIIGFGGRTLKKDKKVPKYVNSPESLVYNKSKVLYGIYQSKRSIISEELCLLVEGYTDVISLHQAGITNVVASSGTALTPDQIGLIKRYTPNVTVLYDGDAAGIKAASRGTELILEQGMNVRIVLLPDGEDPDSAVQQMGAEGFRTYIKEKARDFVLFKADLLLEEAQGDPIRKAALIREIVGTISKVPDQLTRSLYIRETASLMQVEESLLISEVNQTKRSSFRKKRSGPSPNQAQDLGQAPAIPEPGPAHVQGIPDPESATLKSREYAREKDLIRVLLEADGFDVEEQPAVVLILQETNGVELEDPVLAEILKAYREGLEAGKLPTSAFFVSHESEEIRKLVIDIIQKPWEISENWLTKHRVQITEKKLLVPEDVSKTTALLRYRKSETPRQKLLDQIKEATLEGDIRTVNKCLELIQVLNNYRNSQLDAINHFVVNKVRKKEEPLPPLRGQNRAAVPEAGPELGKYPEDLPSYIEQSAPPPSGDDAPPPPDLPPPQDDGSLFL